jgi:hypothetical protein
LQTEPSRTPRQAHWPPALIISPDLTCLAPHRCSSSVPRALSEFADNELTGALPSELAGLPLLGHLDGARNRLSGPLPTADWGPRLKTLDLSDNQLSGALVSAFDTALGLEALFLSNNRFTGLLPLALNSSLTNLVRM